MDLWTSPALDVRPLLVRERNDLLTFIDSLGDDAWSAPTRVPGWTVKDLALHLLDDDLGWLSRGRDHDSSGLLDVDDAGFVEALDAKNQRWVTAARQLSRRVVRDLLAWSGAQMDVYYAAQTLTDPGWVTWASSEPVPNWFDLAQDLTERWVHQMQMREAVGAVGDYRDDYLKVVLDTFVWAVPHQYSAVAARGSAVLLDLAGGDTWTVTSDGTRWDLARGTVGEAHLATVSADRDTGWRWLTGGLHTARGLDTSGPDHLVEPLLAVRAVLVQPRP